MSIVGVGPCAGSYIYPLAMQEIESAGIIAGSSKILGRFSDLGKEMLEYRTGFDAWVSNIESAIRKKKVVILVSGDPGFYSLSHKVIEHFRPEIPRIFPGISSLQLAYARIGRKWANRKVISFHGRERDIGSLLDDDSEMVILVDKKFSDRDPGRILCGLGYNDRIIYIFSNLGCQEEYIWKTTAGKLSGKDINPNSIMILEKYSKDKTRFYGVGVGIGGPGMVTVKGMEAIKKADILCVPRAKNSSSSMALDSIRKYVPDKTVILEFEYPMIKNRKKLMGYWKGAVERIAGEIKEGKIIALATIGDPLIYSTYNYIISLLKNIISPEIIETIPGINSFSFAASRLQQPLLERDEKMAVLPCSRSLDGYGKILQEFETVVLMKIGNNIEKVLELIGSSGREDEAHFFRDMGLDSEIPGIHIKEMESFERGYLSTIIIKKDKSLYEK